MINWRLNQFPCRGARHCIPFPSSETHSPVLAQWAATLVHYTPFCKTRSSVCYLSKLFVSNLRNNKTSFYFLLLYYSCAVNTIFCFTLKVLPVYWVDSCTCPYSSKIVCHLSITPPGYHMHLPLNTVSCLMLVIFWRVFSLHYWNILSEVYSKIYIVTSHVLLSLLFHILTYTLVSNYLSGSTKMQVWQQMTAKTSDLDIH